MKRKTTINYNFLQKIAIRLTAMLIIAIGLSPVTGVWANNTESTSMPTEVIIAEDFNGSTTDLLNKGWYARGNFDEFRDADLSEYEYGGVSVGFHTKTMDGDRAIGFHKTANGETASITYQFTTIAQSANYLAGSFDFECPWQRRTDVSRVCGFTQGLQYRVYQGSVWSSWNSLVDGTTIGFLSNTPALPTQTWLNDSQMNSNGLSNRSIAYNLNSLHLSHGDMVEFRWYSHGGASTNKNMTSAVDNFNMSGNTVKWPTSISVTTAENPTEFGETVTFTATIQHSASVGGPGGSVEFFNGDELIGSASVDSNGQAVFSTSMIDGTHQISADYVGDANFESGSSDPISHTVKWQTTTSIQASQNPTDLGQLLTLTATVTDSQPGPPTGTIEFYDGIVLLGSGALNSSAQASFATDTLVAGEHSIRAKYLGDSEYSPSSSGDLVHTVRTTTITTLQTSKSPAKLGETLIFTATVNSETGTLPSGVVDFYNGEVKLGSTSLDGNGQANYSTNMLLAGEHQITAHYLGDNKCDESISDPVTQTIYTIPTAITVATFKATQLGSGVWVTWDTSLEINIAGFNIFRSDLPAGERQKVNTTLIPVKVPGQTTGAAYEWLDENVNTIPNYWYWLEINDITEGITWYGPVQVTFQIYTPLMIKNQ